jgi:hypothetical protein
LRKKQKLSEESGPHQTLLTGQDENFKRLPFDSRYADCFLDCWLSLAAASSEAMLVKKSGLERI